MMKLLIYGEHNTGKTYLLRRILEEEQQFILIDSTCEEGNKSIINQIPGLFDRIITPKDLGRIIIEKPQRCGIDISWNLERYLESHRYAYLRHFLMDVHNIASFLNANKSLSEIYILGLDEIPLFPNILKNIKHYDVTATGDMENNEPAI